LVVERRIRALGKAIEDRDVVDVSSLFGHPKFGERPFLSGIW
jgi:hypothetical protein